MNTHLKKEFVNHGQKYQTTKSLKCAVITPIGPGHEDSFRNTCLPSIQQAIEFGAGPFQQIDCIPVADLNGQLGRSRARNIAVNQAYDENYDWLFFLDADDIIYSEAFESVLNLVDEFDGIWGSIVEVSHNNPKSITPRPNQINFINDFNTLIECDPFLTIQMGHFVRTHIAKKFPFDEKLDAGEDFKYYLEVWKDHDCVKFDKPLFFNVRGNHSVGPRSATGTDWRVSVDDQIRKLQHGCHQTNQDVAEFRIEDFKPFEGKIAMVVAHPDDETLWAGGLLNRLFPIDVICCSIPRRDPERALCFFEAVRALGHFPILMPFTESEPSMPLKNLQHLELSKYALIITHGKNGEYGHLHHKQLHQFLIKEFFGVIISFGFGRGNLKLSLSKADWTNKLNALKHYDNVSPFDEGKPKWQALLEKYNIDASTEFFEGVFDSRQAVKNEVQQLCKLPITEEQIRLNADYQHFEVNHGKIKNIQGRMSTKLEAINDFLPSKWKGLSVLDIGCDFGFWSFLAASNGANVIGVDRSRPVKNLGHVNIPLLNNLAAKRNNFTAQFLDFEAGKNWSVIRNNKFVFCMSLYHHIFNVCENHDAIWYWLWRNTDVKGTLLWENPTETDDAVVQINLKKHLYKEYTEEKIRSAAERYFKIAREKPALHEQTRTVWHCKPKKLTPQRYIGTIKSGAGGASKAFLYSDERRCKEFAEAVGVYPIPGSLNIQLSEDFDWNTGFYTANFLDVLSRRSGLNQEWAPKRARIFPVEVEKNLGWVFRFESDNHYPKNFIEIISDKRLRDVVDQKKKITIKKL